MTTTHQEIEITYDEKDNRWHFELRGRQRSAESLLKAKEFIDKPVTEKEEKTFKPVDAWLWTYNDRPHKITITSIASSTNYRGKPEVWIKHDGNRSKCDASDCYPDNDQTIAAIVECKTLQEKMNEMGARRAKLKESLKPITID